AFTRFAVLSALVISALGFSTSSVAAFDAIYVIGDSLSDQGNLFRATESVVGTARAAPGADHYFNGRFSNGPVYTDLVAQGLGLQSGPSIAGGNNFAYGLARTNYNPAEMRAGGPFPNNLFPWTTTAEVQAFANRGIHDPDGLFIVFAGVADVADIL